MSSHWAENVLAFLHSKVVQPMQAPIIALYKMYLFSICQICLFCHNGLWTYTLYLVLSIVRSQYSTSVAHWFGVNVQWKLRWTLRVHYSYPGGLNTWPSSPSMSTSTMQPHTWITVYQCKSTFVNYFMLWERNYTDIKYSTSLVECQTVIILWTDRKHIIRGFCCGLPSSPRSPACE